ncbi:gamma-glutamylcyclotransferase-like [Chrysoperla carnea]|uniref:gamma-glutamylcyclotransferase-like n=1 Tax=Chrysoperla carnea TaxID=189513 RepID=UPI001D091106|nr:gamma-glutamylcyclotransferase-like [Chrysoperla carnea]
MGKLLYFAYASNLLSKRIHFTNPSAVRKCVGKLKDYRLDFGHYSNRWKGAGATIVPTPGHTVWGAIWELDDSLLASLDREEGVHEDMNGVLQNMYSRFDVNIETTEGNLITCKTYQQTENPEMLNEGESLPLDRKPSEFYKSVILEGAIESGLPNDYIEKLRKIPSVPVKGELNLNELFRKND